MVESKEAYIAQPSGECCVMGTLHEGEPRGTIEKVAGLDTYITKPKDGKGNGNIMLYFPDVWGLFKNGQLGMSMQEYTVRDVMGF
jgi:hypothetical protein